MYFSPTQIQAAGVNLSGNINNRDRNHSSQQVLSFLIKLKCKCSRTFTLVKFKCEMTTCNCILENNLNIKEQLGILLEN